MIVDLDLDLVQPVVAAHLLPLLTCLLSFLKDIRHLHNIFQFQLPLLQQHQHQLSHADAAALHVILHLLKCPKQVAKLSRQLIRLRDLSNMLLKNLRKNKKRKSLQRRPLKQLKKLRMRKENILIKMKRRKNPKKLLRQPKKLAAKLKKLLVRNPKMML